jgi:glycosyltransferase involved in cell wall biosynthesis
MVERVVVIEPMGFGGICHYTYNLCEAFASRGVWTLLITAKNYELAARPRRFHLYPILNEWFRPDLPSDRPNSASPESLLKKARRRLNSARVMLRIVAVVVRTGASVVHLQWPIGLHDWLYVTALRGLGRRIVYTAHDVLPHDHTHPDDVPQLRRLLKHVDRAILHSEENERTFRQTFSEVSPPSNLVPHGHYFFFSEDANDTAQTARAALGIPRDAHVVLFFGTIRPYKGLADLIKAVARVRSRVADVRLVVAGYPFEEFGPYERAIASAGIRDCTAVYLGYHPAAEVAKFFRAADIVVLPYRSASQSGVAQLAFAFATPVIATRVGGLPEIVEEGHTGLLVDPGDDQALADAMVQLLEDPQLRQSMGTRASEIAASRYSWDRIAEMTLNVYDLAMERHSLQLPLHE